MIFDITPLNWIHTSAQMRATCISCVLDYIRRLDKNATLRATDFELRIRLMCKRRWYIIKRLAELRYMMEGWIMRELKYFLH